MLFYTFQSQEERRKFGGSAFIELQLCKLPAGTALKKIVKVGNIKNWQNDSLYVNDEDLFYKEYGPIFDCGIYNNLKSGIVDIYGINYYAPDLLDTIIRRLDSDKPVDCELLADWLKKAKAHNGFYILGI